MIHGLLHAVLLRTAALTVVAAAPVHVVALDPPTTLAGVWECVNSDAAIPPETGWEQKQFPDAREELGRCDGPSVWLRKEIVLEESVRRATFGISVGVVRGAYQVFVNDVLVGGKGTLSPVVDALREGAAFPIDTVPIDTVPIDTAAIDTAVASANGSAAGAPLVVTIHVVRDAAALGTTQDHRVITAGPLATGQMPAVNDRAVAEVSARVHSELAATLGMSGLFLFIALYHVLVWLLRRDLFGYLWFGLFAFTADVWTTLIVIAGTPLLPITERTTAIAGNFTGSLVNAAFIEFFWLYLTKAPPPRRWRIMQALLVAFSVVGFIPNVGVAWTTSPPIVAVKILIMPWALFELFKLAKRGSREARVLLVGFALAVCGAPAQWWVQSRGIQLAVSPGQAALAVFFLTMAVALAAQFARTLDDVDARARELLETNLSIERFVPFLFLKALDKTSVREVKRGDSTKTVMSVMFCDLRGFTTLAETLGPDETFRFINRYLEKMEPEIHKTGGFINQYLGDGIMALFPLGADSAVDAAVGMCRALEGINLELVKDGKPPLKIGIGIHTGPLMLGTIGGGGRLDSGVVGDVVNTAARLEGITKMYGATILISGTTMSGLKDASRRHLRPLDAVKPKGKSEPMPLVEVIDGDPKALRDQKIKHRADLEQALALYRKGAFSDAAVRFGALAASCPDDGAARAFAERCTKLIEQPPSAWDGVMSLSTK